MTSVFWPGTRVVIGGGCGFLGSYLVPSIANAGAAVTVVDNFESGDRSSASGLPRGVTLIEADLRDRAVCDDVLRDCELFINLAAKASGVGFSRTHHGEMLIDNILCGLVPLQAAQRHGIRHVVMTSTSCVYADDAPVPTAELDPFIGVPERVNEGYGWAKRVHELAARYVAEETGMRITILRPFNLYGANYPWRSTERAHVIPALVKRVLDGEDPLVVWGSGEQRRNFLHGRDAAEVIARVIASGADGAVNVGYEDDISIAELVEVICDVTGRRPTLLFDRSRPDGAPRKAADASRLRALTGGYTPRVSLREGIAEMVAWYERTFTSSGLPRR
jgi:nucleoside-diphosphate-sugar epimerase